jgi:hypothetical protein
LLQKNQDSLTKAAKQRQQNDGKNLYPQKHSTPVITSAARQSIVASRGLPMSKAIVAWLYLATAKRRSASATHALKKLLHLSTQQRRFMGISVRDNISKAVVIDGLIHQATL